MKKRQIKIKKTKNKTGDEREMKMRWKKNKNEIKEKWKGDKNEIKKLMNNRYIFFLFLLFRKYSIIYHGFSYFHGILINNKIINKIIVYF